MCLVLLSILTAASIGHGTNNSNWKSDVVEASGPDFSVTANPEVVVTEPGTTASTNITVTSQDGFAGTVTLRVFLVVNIYPSISPPNISLGPGDSANFTVTLYVNPDSRSGNFTSGFNATSGSTYHSIWITVTVPPTPRFRLIPEGFGSDPFPTVDVHPGGSRNVTFTLKSINNFSGPVALSVTRLQGSTDATFSLSPNNVTLTEEGSANATLTVAAPETASFEGGVLQVNATSGALSQWVRLFFSVREHLALNYDDTITVSPGSSTTARVQLSTNGFSAYVNVTASSPSGIKTSLGPETATVNRTMRLVIFTLTVDAPPTITLGTYHVTVTVISYTIVTVTNASTGVVISRTPKTLATASLTVPVTVKYEAQPNPREPTILGLTPLLFYGAAGGSLATVAAIVTVILRRKKATPAQQGPETSTS